MCLESMDPHHQTIKCLHVKLRMRWLSMARIPCVVGWPEAQPSAFDFGSGAAEATHDALPFPSRLRFVNKYRFSATTLVADALEGGKQLWSNSHLHVFIGTQIRDWSDSVRSEDTFHHETGTPCGRVLVRASTGKVCFAIRLMSVRTGEAIRAAGHRPR